MESEDLKLLKKIGNGELGLKTNEKELKIVDENSLELAKHMIDLRVVFDKRF